MTDQRPRCPSCGEPARYVLVTATVRAVLEPDGGLGKIVRVARDMSVTEVRNYECGGEHKWK